MKKVLASMLVIMAMLLCAVPQAWAEKVQNPLYIQQHGNWFVSLIQSSEESFKVMSTVDTDKQSILRISYLASGKFRNSLVANLNMLEVSDADALLGKTVSCSIRVGNGKMHKVRCEYDDKIFDGFLEINLNPNSLEWIVDAMRAQPSDTISIEVDGMGEAWEYPLTGFHEALNDFQALPL